MDNHIQLVHLNSQLSFKSTHTLAVNGLNVHHLEDDSKFSHDEIFQKEDKQNLIKSEVNVCKILQNNEDIIELEWDDSIIGYLLEEETNTFNTTNYFQNGDKNCISIHQEIMETNLNFYSCDICSKTFVTKVKLKEHEKFTHNPHFECEECHLVLTEKAKFKHHVKSVHKGMVFTCYPCDFKANTKGIQTKHINTLHMDYFGLYYRKRNIIEEKIIHIKVKAKNWKTRKKR